MENYIVSARKYRPMTFNTVIGQGALTKTLKNSIATGKLAHAYLFCGPRGVGKTTCARIFAKTINCLNPTAEGEACGECESCKAFNEGRSLNIHELDAASNNGIDEMRQLIEQTLVPPQVGKYKVFIIDEVHMLSTAAFNAFLKTLEEPPSYVIFVLATTEKHKILPTILSRCQIYDFNRMEVPQIVAHLANVAQKEGISYEEDALNVIAQKADGGMRDALSIFDQVASFSEGNVTYEKVIEDLNILDYDYYFKMTDFFLSGDVTQSMLLLNEVLSKGFNAQQFMSGLASHFRDLLMSRDAQTLPLLEVSENIREKYKEQAQRCKPAYLYKALRLCNDCDINYRQSRNKRLLVELTLIEVAQAVTDDAPGSGRSPIKQLKPLFTAAATGTDATAKATQPQKTAASAQTAAPDPTNVAASPTVVKKTTVAQVSTVHQMKLRTVSLKHPTKEEATSTVTQPATIQTFGNKTVTQEEVKHYWLRYINEMPKDLSAMKGRMKNMLPTLTEATKIEVNVEAENVVRDLEEIRTSLTNYFRKSLDNGQVAFVFQVAQQEKQIRYYNKKDLLEAMLKKSKGLQMLQKNLQLEVE